MIYKKREAGAVFLASLFLLGYLLFFFFLRKQQILHRRLLLRQLRWQEVKKL